MSEGPTAAIIARERGRAAAIIGKRITDWEKFAEEFGEDREIAVYTMLAELEMLINQITHDKKNE